MDILLSKPRGVLTGDELSRYASGVFLTVGGSVDYRYLLPRIFDLSANDLSWWPSPEIVIGTLARAKWEAWSASERAAILGFLSAWFDRWASGGAYGDGLGEIDALLCGMALAGIEITPYLERLLLPVNAAGLIELQTLNGFDAANGAAPKNFWEDAPEGWRKLTDFLVSEVVRRRLTTIEAHPSTNTGPQAT